MKKINKQSGFIRPIIILIIILVIAQFLGYSPIELWNNIIVPVVSFVWKIILIVVDLLVQILRQAYTTIMGLSN